MAMLHKCLNCGVEIENAFACPACVYLASYGTFENPIVAERAREERLTNRRWQMRFNRGELT